MDVDNYSYILDVLSEVMIAFRQKRNSGMNHKEIMEWLKEFELAIAKSHASIKAFANRCSQLNSRIERLIRNRFQSCIRFEDGTFSVGYDIERIG